MILDNYVYTTGVSIYRKLVWFGYLPVWYGSDLVIVAGHISIQHGKLKLWSLLCLPPVYLFYVLCMLGLGSS